jgi:hypothetical protein
LFNICVSADFELERLAKHALEWRDMSGGRPELQFGISRGAQLEQPVLATVVQLDARDGLGVTAIEALGQTQDRRERPDDPPARLGQLCEAGPPALGRGLPVIAGDERDDLDLYRVETAQIAVANQIVRVFVVTFIADMHADVVKQCGVFEPLTFTIGQGMHAARLLEQ